MKKVLIVSGSVFICLVVVLSAIFIPQYINRTGVFEEKEIRFTVFSDLHYYTDMYPVTTDHINDIFNRAQKDKSDFVIQCGDFFMKYSEAKPMINLYMQNIQDIPAYSIYGNHELENEGKMKDITPSLTNDNTVVWGTEDGKIDKDGKIGYYYFEKNGFRLVCVDSNYYYDESTKKWKHLDNGTFIAPEGTKKEHALGEQQLIWLDKVLMDAASRRIPCVVFSHISFSPSWHTDSCDAEEVREIFNKVNQKRPKTVLMAISGHYHNYNVSQDEDIVYLSLPTAMIVNEEQKPNYTDEHIFEFYKYDNNGYLLGIFERKISELFANHLWFAKEPLSATVTIRENGDVNIKGMQTDWMFSYAPESGKKPQIPSSEFSLEK